jgi:hypothetical protein
MVASLGKTPRFKLIMLFEWKKHHPRDLGAQFVAENTLFLPHRKTNIRLCPRNTAVQSLRHLTPSFVLKSD